MNKFSQQLSTRGICVRVCGWNVEAVSYINQKSNEILPIPKCPKTPLTSPIKTLSMGERKMSLPQKKQKRKEKVNMYMRCVAGGRGGIEGGIKSKGN